MWREPKRPDTLFVSDAYIDYAKLETTGISESYENSHCIKTISMPDSYYGFALEVRMDSDTSAITFLACGLFTVMSSLLHPRTGYSTADTQGVLDGDLNEFMKTYLMGNGAAVTDPDELD